MGKNSKTSETKNDLTSKWIFRTTYLWFRINQQACLINTGQLGYTMNRPLLYWYAILSMTDRFCGSASFEALTEDVNNLFQMMHPYSSASKTCRDSMFNSGPGEQALEHATLLGSSQWSNSYWFSQIPLPRFLHHSGLETRVFLPGTGNNLYIESTASASKIDVSLTRRCQEAQRIIYTVDARRVINDADPSC